MSLTLPVSLANLTISHLNFTTNCSNVPLGITVWMNDFNNFNATPGNQTATNDLPGGSDNPTLAQDLDSGNDTSSDGIDQSVDPVDNGPTDAYTDFWTNGTSPEWLAFWRAALASALPTTYMNLTDAEIAQWSNTTDAFEFFDMLNANNYWADPTDILATSYYLASQGGCSSNGTLTKVQAITDMQPACMVQYCCSGSNDEESRKPYPFYPEFIVVDACAFDICQRANQGNPDLGGIGVIAAYFIEASLMALSVINFGVALVMDFIYKSRPKPKWLSQHNSAALASAGVFLDNAVFFSFAVSFAGIIFNSRSAHLLYEDKLGQTATLLAIDAPVAILLLTYAHLDRGGLRGVLVLFAVLLVFIIQFFFRKAKSFNPGTSLCLDWDDFVQNVFRQRFIAKAVWACLVLAFFVSYLVPWQMFRRSPQDSRKRRVDVAWWQRAKSSVAYKMVTNFSGTAWINIPWRRVIALLLAAYAMFDSYIDIRFLWFLRAQEQNISFADNEDQWGYGQILALFVWVPIFVEYFYVFGFERKLWGKINTNLERNTAKRRSYEMIEFANEQKVDATDHPSLKKRDIADGG